MTNAAMNLTHDNLLYAVVVDKESQEIVKVRTNIESLSDLTGEEVENLIEQLAEISPDWKDVRDGLRCGAVFDPETGEKLAFNVSSQPPFKLVIR